MPKVGERRPGDYYVPVSASFLYGLVRNLIIIGGNHGIE
jgi:hypothetical protein